jgi:hypothetical protein
VWKRRVIDAFAILTVGDGLIEILAPREHSRLASKCPSWQRGPPWWTSAPRLDGHHAALASPMQVTPTTG